MLLVAAQCTWSRHCVDSSAPSISRLCTEICPTRRFSELAVSRRMHLKTREDVVNCGRMSAWNSPKSSQSETADLDRPSHNGCTSAASRFQFQFPERLEVGVGPVCNGRRKLPLSCSLQSTKFPVVLQSTKWVAVISVAAKDIPF